MNLKKLSSIVLISTIAFQFANAKILMKPYLQGTTSNSVYVMIESDSKDALKVEYWTAGKSDVKTENTVFFLETEKNKTTYMHRVLLKNLQPNTKYSYKAVQGSSIVDGNTFSTAVNEGTNFRFGIMGDCRSNPDIHGIIATEMKKHNPIISVYLGDLCYNSKYETWKKEFFVQQELELSSGSAFFNAIGNHEGWEQNTKAFQQAPVSTSGKQDYYSFDCGDVHFVVVDVYAATKKGSEQYEFLQKDLTTTKKKWKVVTMHIPAYCAGGHGESKALKKLTTEVFEPNNVDLVLTGHTHFYQHNLVNGIRHLVVGGGGAPLYGMDKGSYTIKSADEFHYGMCDVTPNSMKITIYDLRGKELDKIELKK